MRKLTLSVILVLYANVLLANDGPVPEYRDSELGIAFPPMLAGMEFVGVHKYDQPEAGYSVRYARRDIIKADIYVYDRGLDDIPNGCDNKLVKAEAASTGKVLRIMQERGQYVGVKSLDSGVRPQQGSIQFAWNKYQFSHPAREKNTYTGMRLSESFVTGFGGKFIKIRLTYRKEKPQEGDRTPARLIEEVIQLLKTAATPQEGQRRSFILETDGSLAEQLRAPWLGYLLARQRYITENESQYNLFPGLITPRFEGELEGRRGLVTIWKELKETDSKLEDKYLNELELVHDAGFMREYVWTYLKRASWNKPEKLKMKAFQAWAEGNLKEHKVESYGNIRVAIETAEPTDAPDKK